MSLKTDNFELFKYEDNDVADLRFINDSMDIIDKGINPFYVATQSSTNVYKVTTGLNKTSLANGYSIKVAIPSNSTGAVSIVVDSVTVPVKKPNGNAVTNFKQNGVYSLTYYNSVFILASGGVDDVSFSASDLLTGKTANDSNGEKVNGTMPNKGAVTASLNCGGSYTIPAGYHNGSGKVTANSLSSQTSANAAAKDIIKGKTAWVNGSKITGTATIASLGGKNYKTFSITYTKNTTVHINCNFTPKIILIENYQHGGHRIYCMIDFSSYISGADIEYVTNTNLTNVQLKAIITNVNSSGFDLTLPASETSISGTTVYNIRGIMIS